MAVLNDKYYAGEDLYSDGDIENKILQLVQDGKNLEELDAYDATFPVVYHLSDVRKNIIIWYPFKENASVLEIGAGCGAITGGLCQRAGKVTSVELSMRRASINYERNKGWDNLEIMVGNLNDMDLPEKYDYVILNGVFEYAASFTEGNTPYETFLENIASYLKDDGRILIAIENRLGAKYFAGAPEDHVDKHFVGINDYEGIDTVRTFSKEELREVCQHVGLVCNKFYYPYPDYKFPYEIFTDESINSKNYGRPMFQFSDNRLDFINETKLNQVLVKEQIADRFANSFLVEITRQEMKDVCDISYVKINTDRNKEYQIYTAIWTENGVKQVGKFPISDAAKNHVMHMKDSEQNKESWHSLQGQIGSKGEIVYPFLERESLNDVFASKVGAHDWEGCKQIFALVYDTFLADGEVRDDIYRDAFKKVFGSMRIDKSLLCKTGISIDLILDNIFVSETGYEVIDEEWVFPFPIPVAYIIWRVINECYHKYPQLDLAVSRRDTLSEYGIDRDLEKVFYEWERNFAYAYVGSHKMADYASEMIPFDDNQLAVFSDADVKSGTSTKLYYDDGTGLSEDHTIYSQLMMSDTGFFAKFELPKDVTMASLRWDPLEKPCICSVTDVRTDMGTVTVKGANAVSDYGRKKVFVSADPYYELVGEFSGATELIVEGQIKGISISMYQDIINDMQDQIIQKERYIMGIHNSKLWFVFKAKDKTKELLRICKRKVKSALRRVKNFLAKSKKQSVENLLQVLEKHMLADVQKQVFDEAVDVIVPIYNGYEYLVELFPTLLRTELPARILLVDDQSTDPRVKELEKAFADKHDNVVLLQNDRNYGFVYSVNRGLENTQNHVALVNTDTELPEGWLERLMAPILKGEKIASTTPYTNSGTIFSFPNFCYNNAIYRGLNEQKIDDVFKMFKPKYTKVPTGMGFCMGMNKYAIAEVGKLDYETFEKGYGEENDWCLRAEKLGYRNVQVENLFVYHKHGGSFPSEEKKKLIASHDEIIRNRYPKYFRSVDNYIAEDPNKEIRNLAQMLLDMRDENTTSVLALDHMLGGGATSFLERKVREGVANGDVFTIVRYDYEKNLYWVHLHIGSEEKKYQLCAFSDLLVVSKYFHFDEIWVNELVTYPMLPEILRTIVALKELHQAELIMLMHDYFSLCPSITFMGREKTYCGMPMGNTCASCWMERGYTNLFQCTSIEQWQEIWKEFMLQCSEIRSFSEDTLARVEKTYGDGLKNTLVPHKVEYLFPINKQYKTTTITTIGLLGILCTHKGQDVVECMLRKIEREDLDVKIVLIGECEDNKLQKYKAFSQTGRYVAEDLPKHIYENDIDMFFIPSVWPETFSYTTEEIMQMDMPVACFDLGAPAWRVRKYAKGLVVSQMDGEVALDEMLGYLSNRLLPQREELQGKKIVYVIENATFSSRYRIEHLREEMLSQGVAGDIWDVAHMPKDIPWQDIKSVVIYRCQDTESVINFIQLARKHQVRVLYDVDDLIFDYSMIEGLDFLKGKEYENFQNYTEHIYRCMDLCDGIIVSTDILADCVRKAFPGKEVFVSRNMASTQMAILSNKAYLSRRVDDNEVILGYFSGSNTHNKDFDMIRGTLLSILGRYDNLKIKVGGCIELGQEFWAYEDRIDREGFVDWRKLPEIIASVDINLMPLENTIFHVAKSENKWMEAAFVGVPTIASYNSEIQSHTCNGKDILLCNTQNEWNDALVKMITDADYREMIAKNARERVMEEKLTITHKEELYRFIVK